MAILADFPSALDGGGEEGKRRGGRSLGFIIWNTREPRDRERGRNT